MVVPNVNNAEAQAYQSALRAYSQRDYAQAAKLLQPLVARRPRFAEAHHLLGLCCYLRGELIAAERHVRRALSITKHSDFYQNLGMILQQLGNADGAAEVYEAALRLNPQSPKACNNLANIQLGRNRLDEAVELYRKALAMQPNYAIGYKNLGTCLLRLKRYDEAEAALRRAIELDPSFTECRQKLANLLVHTERFDDAFEVYRSVQDWRHLQFAKRNIGDWSGLESIDEGFLAQLNGDNPPACPPWEPMQMPGVSAELLRRTAFNFAVKEIPELLAPPIFTGSRKPDAGERLRIGYLSSDFFNHATMHLFAGVLENHDREALDIRIYSYSPRREDGFTQRLENTALPVTDLLDLSNQVAASRINDDRIDILVDLKGYTSGARLGITALRPAPVIVNWLGYPGTLGHPRLADYIIGDPTVTPPEHAEFYSERLALMPHCYQPNDRRRPLPSAPSRSAVGLPEDALVFCSFNQFVKLNPPTFDIWSRLLLSVPNGVLWLLKPKQSVAPDNLIREMNALGVNSDRIVFAPFSPQTKHLARLGLADIALDTFPCNSHTTASDALWAGVPLVTFKGETFAGRVAASLLAAHGFPELIAENETDYFEIAHRLATNSDQRAALRARISDARLMSPLFDTARFTSDLERLYRAIAENHSKPEAERKPVVTIG
ncbi:MAG: tetratricopeptide repeat protein [Rhizobiaceae bacterium]|nr:tetratricopeptide repeat protein [Rhizobiaceae bacterium]